MSNLFAICIGAALIVAAAGQRAHSAPLTFEFTATISYLAEHDGATKVNTSVNQSTFAGALVSVSDIVVGRLSYDSNAPLNIYFQPAPPTVGTYQMYSGGVTPGLTLALPSGLQFVSAGDLTIQVANNASSLSGWDIFSGSASSAYDPSVLYQNVSLSLFHSTSSAFQNSAVPQSLKLESFTYKSLSMGWLRYSDGDQLVAIATLTRLTPIANPVPEPISAILMLAGLTSLRLVRCRSVGVRHE
jgi:hypothetical protein